MSGAIEFHPTVCAICNTGGNATELYPPTFDESAFNPEIFSARRLPDRIHYRMVKCNACGLVRSDPVIAPEMLAQLYSRSTFDYGTEVENLQRTYGHYLAKLADYGAKKDALLEIGCGNGFFLEEALRQGWKEVKGVEPGEQTVDAAPPGIKPHIVCDMMREGLFENNHFDAVCLFQVFDHIANPGALLDECVRVMKPGGLLLCYNHNVEALSARVMGEKSPIIDIEHTYLYSPGTMTKLVTHHGFEVLHTGPGVNRYTLFYFSRLLPLPNAIKRGLLKFLKSTPVGRIRLSIPIGNLVMIARKK